MMNPSYRRPAALAATLLLLALGGCGGSAPRSAGQVAAPVRATWAGREDVGRAIDHLNKGEAGEARTVLLKVLQQQPNDPIARGLLRQVDSDPVALLGRENFAYKVRRGETLSDLAGRFLGNPTQFYALGRYNGLTFPVTLSAGQMLRVPGEAKLARPRAAPDKAPPAAAASTRPVAPKPEVVKTIAPPSTDPARATKLRAGALEQLNRGQVDRAVALLRQAEQAEPGNPLVRRDLERAMRIRRTLRP